ncbi:MAG: DUF3592 domain-containing protein [Clostridiales bacterium]|nr:DUF3592 domain-containing protein [Clostridiales bacterium]
MDFDFTQLFLYIPGIVIFLVGGSAIRKDRRMKRLGACTEATVVNCPHVVKKDKQGNEVYNYYNVVVEYPDPRGGAERQTIKAPSEYAMGQQVKLFKDGDKYTLVEDEEQPLFTAWPTALGGALMILLALFQNQGREMLAMTMLALLLVGAGAVLLYRYFGLKKQGLVKIEAEITGVFTRQLSKGTKILRDSKFTYYPIVRYELDGKENIRMCKINDSREKAFPVGDTLTLYYDPKNKRVLEKGVKVSTAVWGGVLLAVGLLAAVSLIAEVLVG